MKEKNNISQFDELFKQGLENHSVTAPGGVFEAVSAATSSSAAGAAKLLVTKWVIGGLVATTMAVGGYYALGTAIKVEENNTSLNKEMSTAELQDEVTREEKITLPETVEVPLIQTNQKSANLELSAPSIHTKQNEHPGFRINDSFVDSRNDYKFYPNNDRRSQVEKPGAQQANYVISVNGNLCQESTFTMSLNTKARVEWYINDKRLTTFSPRIEYQFLSKAPYNVEAYIKGNKVADTFIDMSSPKVKVQFADLGSDVNELSASTSGIRSAVWEFEGKELSNQRKFVYDARLYTSQPYLVTTDKRGCKDTFRTDKSERNAHFKIVQNVITPDGDGKNDDYEVEISGHKTFRIIITDKAGRIVFSSNNPNNHWNGNNWVTQTPCPGGTYGVYVTYSFKNSNKKYEKYSQLYLIK